MRQYRKGDYENDESTPNDSNRRRAYLGAAAQPGKYPGEKVDLKSLPASVQQTINQKAAGGQIVKYEGKTIPMVSGITRCSSKRTVKSRALRWIRTGSS